MKFLNDLLNKENPLCAKTFIGLFGGLALIVRMCIDPTPVLVQAVLFLAVGALAIAGSEAIFKK